MIDPLAAQTNGAKASKNTNKYKLHGYLEVIMYTCCQVSAICSCNCLLIYA
jgi:hypothetical protein